MQHCRLVPAGRGGACLLALTLSLTELLFAETARIFDGRQFGARGDGKSLDSASINRTIQACADAGGGQVRFPPGRYWQNVVIDHCLVNSSCDGIRLICEGLKRLRLFEFHFPRAGPASEPLVLKNVGEVERGD